MSQTPACLDVPSDEPAHIDLLRGEIGAALGFGDEPVTNEQEQNVEAVLRVVQRHYRTLAGRASRVLPSTALAARPEEGWKPIETIPYTLDRHGFKWVHWHLLWFPDEHGGLAVVGGMDADDWLTRDYDRACSMVSKACPTHWMPLPPAPSTPPTAGDGHD